MEDLAVCFQNRQSTKFNVVCLISVCMQQVRHVVLALLG